MDSGCDEGCSVCGDQYSDEDSTDIEYTQCLECDDGYYLDWDSTETEYFCNFECDITV